MAFYPSPGDTITTTSRSFGFELSSYCRTSKGKTIWSYGGGSGDFTDPLTGASNGSAASSSFYNAFLSDTCNLIEEATKIKSLYTSGVFHDSAWVDWYPSDTASDGSLIDSVTFYGVFLMVDTSNLSISSSLPLVKPWLDISGGGRSYTFYRRGLNVPNVFANTHITTYPNPGSDQLHIIMSGAQTGDYTVYVYDLNGRNIETETMHVTSSNYTALINMSECPKGIYMIQLQKDGASKILVVAKE